MITINYKQSLKLIIHQTTFTNFISGRTTPFQVRFVSDFGEAAVETKQNGFQLGYIQT